MISKAYHLFCKLYRHSEQHSKKSEEAAKQFGIEIENMFQSSTSDGENLALAATKTWSVIERGRTSFSLLAFATFPHLCFLPFIPYIFQSQGSVNENSSKGIGFSQCRFQRDARSFRREQTSAWDFLTSRLFLRPESIHLNSILFPKFFSPLLQNISSLFTALEEKGSGLNQPSDGNVEILESLPLVFGGRPKRLRDFRRKKVAVFKREEAELIEYKKVSSLGSFSLLERAHIPFWEAFRQWK